MIAFDKCTVRAGGPGSGACRVVKHTRFDVRPQTRRSHKQSDAAAASRISGHIASATERQRGRVLV